MISLQNAARAAALTGNINQVFSGPSMLSQISELTDVFTLESTDIDGSTADFVPFTTDGYLLLENSRCRIGGLITNALSITAKLQRVAAGFSVTCSITSGSPAVVTAATAHLLVGQTVTGSGIASGTTVTAITATGFTLSAVATATQTGNLTFSGAGDLTTAGAAAASAATAATAGQALAFVPINGGPAFPFLKGDRLRLVIVAVTTLGIGRSLIPSIPFVSRFGPGLTP